MVDALRQIEDVTDAMKTSTVRAYSPIYANDTTVVLMKQSQKGILKTNQNSAKFLPLHGKWLKHEL